MKSHKEILINLFKNKEVIKDALGLSDIFIRDREFVINKAGEKADLVFQDMFDAHKGLPNATCFVLELKKGMGDHEILGQLKKYMETLKRDSYGHWGKVKGVAVAHSFSKSALSILWKEKIRTFEYSEQKDGKPKLKELKIKKVARI